MAELERRLALALTLPPPVSALGEGAAPGLPPLPAASPDDSNPELPTEPDAGPAAAATEDAGLPPLEELVGRIPTEVRAALDELFRARFTGVTRALPKAIKPPAPK